tara:strand:+ start:1535 stop:1708 length:174 start_codon:yes stop_codon:yes gene_type:complete
MATNPLILGWICKNNMLGMPTLPLTVEMALYGHLWGFEGVFEVLCQHRQGSLLQDVK